jgi:uncharacterized membrane protein YphA (DoxX/SURF4 family)
MNNILPYAANIVLWILQILLAGLFTGAGIMKLVQSKEKLMRSGFRWTARFPRTTVRFIGIAEILGAVGLIFPWTFIIYPILTPFAAVGLATLMLLAILHHLKYGETNAVMLTSVVFVLSVIVAIGRFYVLP